jgi:RNA polymerase sigma-70 factor (ECF subfamily)
VPSVDLIDAKQTAKNKHLPAVFFRLNRRTRIAKRMGCSVDYSDVSAGDVALSCLRIGDEAGWIEFMRRFNHLIAGVVIRVARRWGETNPDLIEDLIQETYLKLCTDRLTLLEKFRPNHPNSIFEFIKVFTANVVHDHLKATHSRKRGGEIKMELISDGEREADLGNSLSSAKSMERAVLLNEIDCYLREIGSGPNFERDRMVFWLYYRIGLTARAISDFSSIGLTTKGVESTLLRLTQRVKSLMAHLPERDTLEQEKGIHPAESL